MSDESVSAGTARPDAAPTKDAFDRLVDLIEEYAIDERAHAREAYCEPPGHDAGRERAANIERLQSRGAVLDAIAALRSRLAEREAALDKIGMMVVACSTTSAAWNLLPKIGAICEQQAASAAVAPAGQDGEICANCGKPRSEHLVSTRGRGHHHEWCYRDDKGQSDAKQFSVFAVAPAAREPNTETNDG